MLCAKFLFFLGGVSEKVVQSFSIFPTWAPHHVTYTALVVYLNFQKEFDKGPYRRLLAEVKTCRMAGGITNLIENSIINDTKQRPVGNARM